MTPVEERLRSIVGPCNLTLRDADRPLFAVTPEEEEQVRKLVLLCAEEEIKIYTSGITGAAREGIELDLGRLNRIFAVDPENLFATVGPGVTFDQLRSALKEFPEPMKLAFPVAAPSPSVLRCYLERAVTPLHASLLGRTLHISNLHILLPSGKIYKTGSHIISEEDNWREEDYGPGIGYLFFGAKDTLGICLRGVVSLYPVQAVRAISAWSLPGKAEVVALLAEGARRGLWVEALAANRDFLTMLLRSSPPGDRPWVVLASIEGSRELVRALQQQATAIAGEAGGRAISGESLASLLERPWLLAERRLPSGDFTDLPFFAVPGRVPMLDNLVHTEGPPPAEVLVPLKGGRSFYCEYDLLHSTHEKEAVRDSCRQVLRTAREERIATGQPSWLAGFDPAALPSPLRRIMREIKNRFDPGGLLNPHLRIAEEGTA